MFIYSGRRAKLARNFLNYHGAPYIVVKHTFGPIAWSEFQETWVYPKTSVSADLCSNFFYSLKQIQARVSMIDSSLLPFRG